MCSSDLPASLSAFAAKLRKTRELGLDAPRWELQNRFHDRYCGLYDDGKASARDDEAARALNDAWMRLAEALDFDSEVFACRIG